jgi:hypothetical protein
MALCLVRHAGRDERLCDHATTVQRQSREEEVVEAAVVLQRSKCLAQGCLMAANGPCVVCGKPCGWGVANGQYINRFRTTFPVGGERQFIHQDCLPKGAA